MIIIEIFQRIDSEEDPGVDPEIEMETMMMLRKEKSKLTDGGYAMFSFLFSIFVELKQIDYVINEG